MQQYRKTALAGFFALGSNGESMFLTESEKLRVLDRRRITKRRKVKGVRLKVQGERLSGMDSVYNVFTRQDLQDKQASLYHSHDEAKRYP